MIMIKKGNILFYFEIIIAFGMLLFSVLSIRGTTSKDVSFTDIKRTFEDYETMKGLRIGGKDDAERRYGISFSERGNCYIWMMGMPFCFTQISLNWRMPALGASLSSVVIRSSQLALSNWWLTKYLCRPFWREGAPIICSIIRIITGALS